MGELKTGVNLALSVALFSFTAIFSFSLFVSPALAAPSVWACDINGIARDSFYTNDTVYACGKNLTAGVSGYANIYIVNDTSTWTENASLSDVSIGYRTVATNSTGDLPPGERWPYPWEGHYDMVADIDRNAMYNSTDCVDSTSTLGFSVILQPLPTLKFALGSSSPSAHNWDLSVNKSDNLMMHLKVTAYENEDITLNWISITAGGSGNDKTGVKYAKLVKDVGGDGIVNATDPLLSYKYYLQDNGIILFEITGGERIYLGNSTYFFVMYVMTDNANIGDTFKFQVTAADGKGVSSGTAARITGLPFDSEVTLITGTAAGTTTTTTAAAATTTTSAPETTTTSNLISTEGLNYAMIIGLFAVVIIIILVAVYLLFKEKETYTFEEEK